MLFRSAVLSALVAFANGFGPLARRYNGRPCPTPSHPKTVVLPAVNSLIFQQRSRQHDDDDGENRNRKSLHGFRNVLDRFDTIKSAGLEDVKVAGLFQKLKELHNPKTYLGLALLAGLRYKWCFRSPYFWFAVGFCIKWYRARYVFKIPVWDRQPNWNNIITSKEQEKDLKAFTCKKCGSTLFIAKTREFFFEGDTGIGGLGCFSCGAKGKENFTMDRDRIVEDVGDMDDYFDYERPLDFVSRAERRKILKETGGDEEAANQLLIERSGGSASTTETAEGSSKTAPNGEAGESPSLDSNDENIVDVESEDDARINTDGNDGEDPEEPMGQAATDISEAEGTSEEDDSPPKSEEATIADGVVVDVVKPETAEAGSLPIDDDGSAEDSSEAVPAEDPPKDVVESQPVAETDKAKSAQPVQDDDLDALGMDDL